jgi:hypothetical protein
VLSSGRNISTAKGEGKERRVKRSVRDSLWLLQVTRGQPNHRQRRGKRRQKASRTRSSLWRRVIRGQYTPSIPGERSLVTGIVMQKLTEPTVQHTLQKQKSNCR